jgi:[NiFe] hydrogenase diaphorase moiety small subunit
VLAQGFPPHGSCKLCVVKAAGRHVSACATPAKEGWEVESNTPEINGERRGLLQMLFVEGNHFCPSCEKSGNCELQALAYEYEMLTRASATSSPTARWTPATPTCCSTSTAASSALCVRASREIDGKSVFALTGRGIGKHLVVNAESGQLGDTDFSADNAAHICPVGDPAQGHGLRGAHRRAQLRRGHDPQQDPEGVVMNSLRPASCASPPPRWPAASAATCPSSTSTSTSSSWSS